MGRLWAMPADELARGFFSYCPCQADYNLQQESGVENRNSNILGAVVMSSRELELVFSSWSVELI